MNKKTDILESEIEGLVGRSRKRVGLIIKEPSAAVVRGLNSARRYSEPVIVGEQINGFECFAATKNQEDALIDLLVGRKVDGIVRGQGEYQETLAALQSKTGVERFYTPAILKDVHGRVFILTLVNDFEGHTPEDKTSAAREISSWLRMVWGIESEIVVMSAWRAREWAQDYLGRSMDDAEAVVGALSSAGLAAQIHDKIDQAVASGNLIIPINGTLGHTIYRALCMLGGGTPIGVPMLGSEYVIVDDSKYEKDFSPHIKFACAWANQLDVQSRSDRGMSVTDH